MGVSKESSANQNLDMDKKVVFGIAAVLAVVTVAVVVAVLVTGTEVTSKPQNETESTSNKTLEIKEGPLTGSTGPPGPNTGPEGPGSRGPSTGPPTEPGSTAGPFTGSSAGPSTGPTAGPSAGPFPEISTGPTAGPYDRPPQEVFMQTNNGFHGGGVIKAGNEVQKVIGYDIVGKHADGVNKTLRMETLAGASVSGDVLQLGEISYERHTISPDIPNGSKLRPGLYASRLGGDITTGWYDEAAETKLGDSMGILSFSYKGPTFVGVKLVGDTYVPAGEESTRVNTTDGAAEVKWASPGYQSPNWKPSRLDREENMNGQGHFTIITSSGNREYFTELVHLDEMVEVDAGVAVRFAHLPSPLASEGP